MARETLIGMRITLISGADGAPFAHQLATALSPDDEIVVIAPTVRGHISAGLQASPDLDALLTPADAAQTFSTSTALAAIGYVPRWQLASDQAVAARIVRTDLTASGTTLTDATVAAAARAGLPYRLLPVTDQRAEFRVVIGTDDPRAIHIDEYLDDPAAFDATQLLLVADQTSVSPAVAQVLADTDVLVIGPSSRTLAIDPVLRTPGLTDLIGGDLTVLVVEHEDDTPADLVRVAGLRETDPGVAQPVANDAAAVVAQARSVLA